VAVRFAVPLLVMVAACSSSGGGNSACAGGSPPPGVCPGDPPLVPVDASAFSPMGIGCSSVGASNPTCTSSADCLPGQVCCGSMAEVYDDASDDYLSVLPESSCHSAPCSTILEAGPQLHAVQLCQSSVECVQPGLVCGAPLAECFGGGSVMTCSPPEDAGRTDASQTEAAIDGASTSDAFTGEAAPSNDSGDSATDVISRD
jgi:hypothetical protein